jgi:hypothetical protein
METSQRCIEQFQRFQEVKTLLDPIGGIADRQRKERWRLDECSEGYTLCNSYAIDLIIIQAYWIDLWKSLCALCFVCNKNRPFFLVNIHITVIVLITFDAILRSSLEPLYISVREKKRIHVFLFTYLAR